MRPLHMLLPGLVTVVAVVSLAHAGQPSRRPSDLERGETLYVRHCVSCHGETLLGNGPAAANLVGTVPNIRGKVRADEAAVKVVLRGKGLMPGYMATMDAHDARRVLRFMIEASKPQTAQVPEKSEAIEEDGEEAPVDDAPTE